MKNIVQTFGKKVSINCSENYFLKINKSSNQKEKIYCSCHCKRARTWNRKSKWNSS